jgi:hypothetical protein
MNSSKGIDNSNKSAGYNNNVGYSTSSISANSNAKSSIISDKGTNSSNNSTNSYNNNYTSDIKYSTRNNSSSKNTSNKSNNPINRGASSNYVDQKAIDKGLKSRSVVTNAVKVRPSTGAAEKEESPFPTQSLRIEFDASSVTKKGSKNWADYDSEDDS